MGIEIRDDDLYTSAMPAGSWLVGGQTASDAAPTAFGREAIYNYLVSALATVASSGSASDLSSGTLPLGRLHSHLQDISNIAAPSTNQVIAYDGANFTAVNLTSATVDGVTTSDIGVTVQAWSAALDATTASYTTADETKIDYITVTASTDLDAIRTRISELANAVVIVGSWDASAGTFPGSGTAQTGESYIVTVTGTVDSVAFTAGDRIVAIADNASTSTYAANWLKLDYTDLVTSVAGKTGAVTLTASDVSGVAATVTTTRGDILRRGASADERYAIGTSGYALLSDGTDPTWTGFSPTGTGAATRSWLTKAREFLSVEDFGAVGDGSTNDATAIGYAIAAAFSTGRELRFQGSKTYAVASTITIGDGSTSAPSTLNGLRIRGMAGVDDGVMAAIGGAVLKWTGPAGGAVLQIAGPIHSIDIDGLVLDCNDSAGYGVTSYSMYGCTFRNVHVRQWTIGGYLVSARDVSGNVPGFTQGAMDNVFESCYAWQPTSTSASWGLYLQGGSTNNIGCSRNVFRRCTFFIPGDAGTYGIVLDFADNNQFIGVFTPFGAASSGNGIRSIGYTSPVPMPVENMFVGCALQGAVSYSGSPPLANWIIGHNTRDAIPIPDYASGFVVLDGHGTLQNLGKLGIGVANPDKAILDVNLEASSRTVAKFGSTIPMYLHANDPSIGFNAYILSGAYKYGKGSSSDYAARLLFDQTSGSLSYGATSSAGNEDATATMTDVFSISRSGVLSLISGGSVNWGSSDVTLTNTTTNLLTFDGGTFQIAAGSALQVGASVPFSDSSGTLTLQNVDALDSTTESTIESAIDTLPNLGSADNGASGTMTLNGTSTGNVLIATGGGKIGFGTSPLPGVAAATLAGDFVMSGESRGILGNIYFNGGWLYTGDGYGWGVYEGSGNVYFVMAEDNASGAGASATPVAVLTLSQSGYVSPATLVNAANDAAAASAGVPVGALYRNGSDVQVRVT